MDDSFMKSFALNLSEKYTNLFVNLEREGKLVNSPFYGEVYDLSYGQANSSYDMYKKILVNAFGTHNDLHIGELFGGEGFELLALARNTQGNRLLSLDIDHKYHQTHIPHVEYSYCDIIEGNPYEFLTETGVTAFDMLFCGAANISHSCIHSIKDFQKHMHWCSGALKRGGVLVCSVQDLNHDEDCMWHNFSYWAINYGPHKGKYLAWCSITEYNRFTNELTYTNLCALKTNKDQSLDDVEKAWFVNRGYSAKNWHPSLVRDFALESGHFEHAPELYSEDTGEFLIFRKIDA